MTSVLLAEDDSAISEPLSRALGGRVTTSSSRPMGRRRCCRAPATSTWSSWISGCPGRTGWRSAGGSGTTGRTVPVLILTARADEVDTVVGLDAGPTTTWASRSGWPNCWPGSARCCAGAPRSSVVQGVRIDAEARRAGSGTRVELANKEFELLRAGDDAGQVVTREDIMREVWHSNGGVLQDAGHAHLLAAPQAGRRRERPAVIATVRGVGSASSGGRPFLVPPGAPAQAGAETLIMAAACWSPRWGGGQGCPAARFPARLRAEPPAGRRPAADRAGRGQVAKALQDRDKAGHRPIEETWRLVAARPVRHHQADRLREITRRYPGQGPDSKAGADPGLPGHRGRRRLRRTGG